tara:strand:+ start:1919 stop:2830 length:912 start_codon:yes stop_codon:yes gene_type:complete
MNLSPPKTSFGRNETFSLRYSWLNKGLKEFKENEGIFLSQDAPLVLGVGKNMVSSIKYWLGAYQILDFSEAMPSQTKFGEILEAYDPYLENSVSLWLLHWKLCTNPSNATLYYWFFNCYKKNKFTKIEVLNDLNLWLDDIGSKKISKTTLQRDVLLLLKTFSSSQEETKNFEELLENPFFSLNLLSRNNDGSYMSSYEPRDSINSTLLGFCILEIFNATMTKDLFENEKKRTQMPVGEFLNEQPSISRIFRINESFFYQLLDDLIKEYPNIFGFNETAGQRIIELKKQDIDSNDFARKLYKQK